MGEDGMVPWFDYLKAEGYGLSRQLGQGGQSFGQVCLICIFAKCVYLFMQCHTYRNGDRGTLVQIVVLRQDPVRYILEMFWGTHNEFCDLGRSLLSFSRDYIEAQNGGIA